MCAQSFPYRKRACMNKLVNYDDGIVQMINAVRSYLNISVHHSPNKQVNDWLNEQAFDQVVVLLIDGMGSWQIDAWCDKQGFLNKHRIANISTVYPPTTSAATTSLITGKMPCETGWLGWQQYFDEIDEHLVMFLNQCYYKKTPYDIQDYTWSHVPVHNMVDECQASGISSCEIFPAFREGGVHSFQELCQRIVYESTSNEHRYVYAYWDGYDDLMHRMGASAPESIQELRHIDQLLADTMAELNEHTGLIIVADHGHIDVESKYMCDYPELMECFRILPSFEPRTLNFYIKDGYHTIFKERFDAIFSSEFTLLSKEEVLQSNLFGSGEHHPRFQAFLGDYLAIAMKHTQIVYDHSYQLKGNHAGMTNEELLIPLILYSKKHPNE